MKEMVGGCCVCSDERGWAENPLVYCDGHGCNVAVHQACYGIIQVPTGPWFCRKCESQERAARVRCELCPLKDGALKRTDNGGWCHVVCGLFIPEAWFANVQTMEPIMLKNVPPDRFNRMCYICEENGKEVSKASTGACMPCNRNGCKLNFHATCAQANGFLCEESGSYGNNVKYCGYCSHHYKKLKKDSNIKTIPAFKPIPADNATPDSTPEKSSNEPKVNISAEHKNRESFAARQLSGLTGPPFDPKGRETLTSLRAQSNKAGNLSLSHKHMNQSTQANKSGNPSNQNNSKNDTDNKTNDTKNQDKVTTSSSSTTTSVSSTTTTSSSSSSITTVAENKLMPDTIFNNKEPGKLFSPLTDGQSTVTIPPVTTHVAFPTSLDGMISVMVNSNSSTPSADTESTNNRPRKARAGSLDKDKKSRRGKTSLTSRHRSMKSSVSEDNDESPPVVKRSRKKSESTVVTSISSTTTTTTSVSVINNVSTAITTSSSSTLGPQNPNVFGGEPHFPNPISRTPFSHVETATLPSNLPKVETDLTQSTSQISSLLSSGVPNIDRRTNRNLLGPPKPSNSSILGMDPKSSETPCNMEELLERQWQQGSHFLMEQGQHFDIASLLNCLHQLKTENKRLAEYVRSLISRRDHLLAVNARLSLPFGTNQNANFNSESTIENDIDTRGMSTPNHLDPNHENISDGESSPINVVDTPSESSHRNSPVIGGDKIHDSSLRHQLFPSASTQGQNSTETMISANSSNSIKDSTAKDKT
ncbi:Protein AF-17 [Mactra antiquata]